MNLTTNYPSRTVVSVPRPPTRSKGNHSCTIIFRASRVCSEHELSWIIHELTVNYPSRTVVSAPRPPTRSKGNHSPTSVGCLFGCWRTGHGGPRPTMVCHANHKYSSHNYASSHNFYIITYPNKYSLSFSIYRVKDVGGKCLGLSAI